MGQNQVENPGTAICEEKKTQDQSIIDITKFDQGPEEIIKYMDYMPEDKEQRMALLISFMRKCVL